jgi:ATP-dependent Clp protease adaptor protein ClpS
MASRALNQHFSIRFEPFVHGPVATGRESPGTETTDLPAVRTRLEPRWYVILHDDQLHTYQYVIDMVMKLFNKPAQEAFLHAIEVDTQGVTILARLPRNEAESKRNAIQHWGGDPALKSSVSMKATIEPVDD